MKNGSGFTAKARGMAMGKTTAYVPHDEPTEKAITMQMTMKMAGSMGAGMTPAVVRMRNPAVSSDPETLRTQAEAARARAEEAAASEGGEAGDGEAAPANLKAAGAFLETTTSPDFNASWAFVLEPVDGSRTRLIERFRVAMDQDTAGARLGAPMLGFGVFLMVRRQLLGIRDRVERIQGSAGPVVAPSPA